MSGTPISNDLADIWSLLNFVLPNIFDSQESFEEWFSRPFQNAGLSRGEEGAAAATEAQLNEEEKLLIMNRLHHTLRPFLLRRTKDQVTTLPPKTEYTIKCALPPWQAQMYEQIRSKTGIQVVGASGKVREQRYSNIVMQLRKVVNHPFLFEQSNASLRSSGWFSSLNLVRCSGKFVRLHRMLPKLIRAGHKILLYSQFSTLLDVLEEYLEWRKIKYVRLDGGTPAEDRAKAQATFNDPNIDCPLFIMTTRAGGLGLNMQSADTVIMFDSDWNPQVGHQWQ